MSVGASFHIDTTDVRRAARTFGTNADRWLMDELTGAFIRGAKIAQHEANVLIKGGEGSKLAKASKVMVKVSGSTIEGIVDWDDARSPEGFPYAAAVDRGRVGFSAKQAKALRFEIGGKTVFRKSVGPAPAQDFTGRGQRAAEPKIVREVNLGVARWASRMDAAV